MLNAQCPNTQWVHAFIFLRAGKVCSQRLGTGSQRDEAECDCPNEPCVCSRALLPEPGVPSKAPIAHGCLLSSPSTGVVKAKRGGYPLDSHS